ncbi:unnamed protein product [Dovyalis caffra]|uniref:Acid phosphatase n=1 Tax=Dovyalis caffra TaxID=77055 RepID=A0AAV1RMU1_9ROSI|nr:unnamed protein product [Dovyalis caffra]
MAKSQLLLPSLVLLLFILISKTISQSIIQLSRDRDDVYCNSWRFSVETNDVGYWDYVPSGCVSYVQDYMTGDGYRSDSEVVASYALAFAKTVEIAGDGKDAWVFDVDETLLSNLPYYVLHGFGSEPFDELSFDKWVDLAEAPALQASLDLYKELKQLGFNVFMLTGRSEYQRNATGKNLLFAGYSDWERLILRESSDKGKPATLYKSQKRLELVNEGYRIHGNSGDQWSDLFGFAVSRRSFKLPNPMYYIP